MIFDNDVQMDDESDLIIINNSIFNTFNDWELRQEYSKKVYVLSVIPEEQVKFRSSGYSCTCRTYMNEYVCQHALAISMVTHTLPERISMNLPIGKRKGPGRPKKAVKGALNYQEIYGVKKNIIELAVAKELSEEKLNNGNDDDAQEGMKHELNLISYFVLTVSDKPNIFSIITNVCDRI